MSSGDTVCLYANTSSITMSGAITMRPGSGMKVCSESNHTVDFSGNWNFYTSGSQRTIEIYGDFNRTSSTTFAHQTTMTVHSGAQADFTLFGNSGANVDIINNDTITFSGALSFSGANSDFTNNGYVSVAGVTGINSNGNLINTGTWDFNAAFSFNSGSLVNDGNFNVNSGGMILNTGASIDNSNELYASGDITLNSGDIVNNGIMESGQRITISGGTSVDIRSGIFIGDDLTINNGNFITGTGGQCSAFLIKDDTHINNGVNLIGGGDVVVTDSNNLNAVNTNNCGAGNCGLSFEGSNSCYTVLGPSILSFDGIVLDNEEVLLQWDVSNAQKVDRFSIEKSLDGVSFETVGEVVPDEEAVGFQYYDEPAINSSLYYRLIQAEENGRKAVSEIISVDLSGQTDVFIYPTPASSTAFVTLGIPDEFHLRIFDPKGRMMFEDDFEGEGISNIDVSEYSKGIYTVVIATRTGVFNASMVVE